jgi:hypothetical protein
LRSWLMSIFASNNASWIPSSLGSKMPWLQDSWIGVATILFNHWPLKRPYAKTRCNSQPKGWARAICLNGTRRTRTYYYCT